MDDLAEQLGIDPLEIRARERAPGRVADRDVAGARRERRPAAPASTPCGRAGRPCARRPQRVNEPRRRPRSAAASGSAAMWYGIGNTSLPNPSTIEIGVRADGTVVLFCGATDIGQGSNTILAQIAADALGVPLALDRARRSPTPTHARRGQDLGLAPDVRVGQRDPARRRGPAPPAPDARRGRPRRDARARRRAGGGAGRRDGLGRRAARAAGRGSRLRAARDAAPTTRRRRRSTPTGRASRTRPTPSAPRSPRSTSTSSSAPSRCAGSSRPTTSVGRSTRRWSRARSRAASRRASAWR